MTTVPEAVYSLVAVILLAAIGVGLIRIWIGPRRADQMLAAQLFGTGGVALLLVLGELQNAPALRNAALILTLLAVMSVVAFVSRVWRADRGSSGRGDRDDGPGDGI